MAGRLEGKVALVTGAASGIGAATARLMAAEGAKVVLADVADAGPVAAEIGENALALRLDVTDPAGWAATVAETEKRFGGLNILVNNAGIIQYAEVCDFTPEQVRKLIDVNLIGAIFGVQASAPAIERSGGGAIVNMSSSAGMSSHNGMATYAASKWGLRGFTKAVALELGRKGIRVNSIHPGGVLTPLANPLNLDKATFDANQMTGNPVPRSCTPEEIAQAVLFLAGPEGSYCSGAELAVDGGMTCGHYIFGLPGAPPADASVTV